MEKVRVYELAKELNTTSKRLMEKLGEVNITVKNHMSLLEDHELASLYKHIGIIKHDDKKVETDDKKAAPVVQPPVKQEQKKDVKSAPRIIRTTEIIINSKNDNREVIQHGKSDYQRNDVRGGARNDNRHDFVRSSDSNSGLMAGYVRDTRPDFSKETKPYGKQEQRKDIFKDHTPKEAVKAPEIEKAKVEIKQEKELDVSANVSTHVIESEINNIKTNVNKPTGEPIVEKQTKHVEKAAEVLKTDSAVIVDENLSEQGKMQLNQTKKEPVEVQQNTERKAQHSDRPQQQGDRPQQQGDRLPYQGSRSYHSDRPYQGDRPQQQGDRPPYQGNRPYQGDRPQQQGDRLPYQGSRPYQGDRPQQQGDRPPYQGNRPYQGDRPQQQGDRPPYQGNRPYQGDRPQQQGDRLPYQGSRPYQGDRPQQQGDRPPYQGSRPYQGDRPQQQGDRPPYQGNRPYQGDRPQQQGDRPPYQGNRPYQQGDRPQYQGNRPYQQGDRPQYQGDRPQYGDRRPQGGGGFRPGQRPLEMPKNELSLAQKEEMSSQRSEVRREFTNKDADKDVKREQKRDVPKSQAAGKIKKFNPQTVGLTEKKGVSEILSEDFILQEFYGDTDAKKKKQQRPRKDKDGRTIQNKHIPSRAVLASIQIPESITVKDLAEALKKTSTDIIKKLMIYGMMATLNQEVDFDTATVIAEEYGVKTEHGIVVNEEDILFDDIEEVDEAKLKPRPPVVVVMGHVDHGKTSLLDAIRSANVLDTEAGGITQHIGAYTVKINDRNITFLDTPGHEAFTAMRARGAQVTDIAILVVAADDGVMPQTVEAINHAKAANVSIIVAINKIDKPGANPEKVKQELTQHGLVSEEWGGDVICVNVSAKKRENIDHLLEMVLLSADVLELKADPDRQAKGTIIEAKLDKNRGPVSTLIVQRGTLLVGDSIVTGTIVGRIRAMNDDKGNSLKSAGPSTPVEIIGMPDVPEAGEIFYAIKDEKVARQLAEKRKLKLREQTLKASAKVSLEELYAQIKEGKVKDLNLIVKADVQGSVEAVKQSIEKLTLDEVRIKIIHGGVGAITEYDVKLAEVTNAIIIGFNVRPAPNVAQIAEAGGVDIRMYKVIYNAIEDIKAAMKGMLEPTFKEVILGHTEIRQIIKVSGVGTIAGCYVLDGKITRNSEIRLLRNGVVVHEGKLASLKRFKDDAKEVLQSFECGLSIEKFNDIKENDVVESFIMEEVAR